MSSEELIPVYELSVNARVTWQAHSLSNQGTNGSNRLLARHQLLANGDETDACSGNILKHMHAALVAEYLEAGGVPLCAACSKRDGRRAAALIDQPGYQQLTMETILQSCGLCDSHGFMIPGKNASSDGKTVARQRISKHTLVDFSFTLALPTASKESTHLVTRSGASKEEGQMLMKMPARSGIYASCVRYKTIGVGMDTENWRLVVKDPQERRVRHQAILSALEDAFLSPDGALTATMLPHLSGLYGAVVVRKTVGRAPIYSPLSEDFVERLGRLGRETCQVIPFEGVDAFADTMTRLNATTEPALPRQERQTNANETS